MQKNTKIRISSLWLPVVLLFAYFGHIRLLLCFLLSSFLHELGHIFVLRLMGKRIQNMSIGITGSVIQNQTLSYTEELLTAVAGPAVNLLLLILFHESTTLFMLNLSLLCYNMLPILPLDGGRIITVLLEKWMPERTVGVLRGIFAAMGCALFFSILLGLQGMADGTCWILIVAFIWHISFLIWQEKRLHFLR